MASSHNGLARIQAGTVRRARGRRCCRRHRPLDVVPEMRSTVASNATASRRGRDRVRDYRRRNRPRAASTSQPYPTINPSRSFNTPSRTKILPKPTRVPPTPVMRRTANWSSISINKSCANYRTAWETKRGLTQRVHHRYARPAAIGPSVNQAATQDHRPLLMPKLQCVRVIGRPCPRAWSRSYRVPGAKIGCRGSCARRCNCCGCWCLIFALYRGAPAAIACDLTSGFATRLPKHEGACSDSVAPARCAHKAVASVRKTLATGQGQDAHVAVRHHRGP